MVEAHSVAGSTPALGTNEDFPILTAKVKSLIRNAESEMHAYKAGNNVRKGLPFKSVRGGIGRRASLRSWCP